MLIIIFIMKALKCFRGRKKETTFRFIFCCDALEIMADLYHLPKVEYTRQSIHLPEKIFGNVADEFKNPLFTSYFALLSINSWQHMTESQAFYFLAKPNRHLMSSSFEIRAHENFKKRLGFFLLLKSIQNKKTEIYFSSSYASENS